ncbi:MAG TPA: protein-glutamate O-methyltransferase CheR [Caulobacteraceae bacterium]|jgi:chemotaxis protein methyltransferase CheR|nr:protein-glutamate O-methyltransferase CheR [Caulobacteraceae bacterium]
MKPEDLEFVAAMARARTGLMLGSERAFFVESRLSTLARREGLPTVDALVAQLRAAPDEALIRAAVEVLATPETSFFRDRTPFDHLRDEVLPELAARRGRVRVWSAGCSTGQEPYSLAMMVEEHGSRFPNLKLEIVATDLSTRALEKAQSGLYTQFEVQRGLPIRLLIRHFEKAGDNWQASARLRQTVRWGRLNLMNDFSKLGRFDVIFCRNVLSYFDPTARREVLSRLAVALAEDGCLILGAGEAADLPEAFEPARGGAGLHRRNPGYGKAAA